MDTNQPLNWAFQDAMAPCETRWTVGLEFTHQQVFGAHHEMLPTLILQTLTVSFLRKARSPRCQRRIRDAGPGHSQFIDTLSTVDYVQPDKCSGQEFQDQRGIAMILKKIVGAGAIAGALGFSAIGLAGVANAAPTPPAASSVVHQAQLAGWHGGGGGWHGGGGWRGGRGWGGPGWGGPGRGWGGPPRPCVLLLCI